MQRIDGSTVSHGGGTAHPATLLALAIGVALGAYLSSVPAKSAELDGNTGSGPGLTAPADKSLGAPKRVQTVRIPVEAATTAAVPAQPAKATWNYDGDATYRSCIDNSDGTNSAWSACGGALVDREDARLNASWKRVYAPGSDAKSKDLLDEQRAWITFKEASCRFYASGAFGREGQVLSFPVCRAGIIAQRTAILDGYGEEANR